MHAVQRFEANMITVIALAAGIAVIAVLLYAATGPDGFRVERRVEVRARPDLVFSLIDDFEQWLKWSPYEKRDPSMKRTRKGPGRGLGSAYAWESSKIGAGRMEIIESIAPSRIGIRLDFLRPFRARNIAEFTLAPDGSRTVVTWAMHGRRPYVAKLLAIFIDMDRVIGCDFEAGLASLKSIAEAG